MTDCSIFVAPTDLTTPNVYLPKGTISYEQATALLALAAANPPWLPATIEWLQAREVQLRAAARNKQRTDSEAFLYRTRHKRGAFSDARMQRDHAQDTYWTRDIVAEWLLVTEAICQLRKFLSEKGCV